MRIPVDWLNEYVPNNLAVGELANTLTNVGLEVEAVEDAAGGTVLDIKVLSNRGDCLSVEGIARELAMALRAGMRSRAAQIAETGPPAGELARVKLDDPVLCPRYSARIVRGVKIAPSPEWAQRRLEQCGLRPINNVVDATNLVMLEVGQPLHAFDYRLLRAPKSDGRPVIIVRRARAGERLVTIDGVERELTPEVLVIADPGGPVALAGIMGGMQSEIHEGTTEVLLESAHFHPGTVRRGARALGMSTEASYRFERTVDPGGTVRALDRACELIAAFCVSPVEIAAGVLDAYPRRTREAVIRLRPARANQLLGTTLSAEEMAELLRRLSLDVSGTRTLSVRIPTFRQDLKQEIDLVEEIARAHDYQSIAEHTPAATPVVGGLAADLAFERQVRGLLRGLGLSEAVTSSLEGPQDLARLCLPEGHALSRPVVINNAKTVDRSQLRTTLVTSLLNVVATNRRQGVTGVSIFELGRVYLWGGENELPRQPQHVAIAGAGKRWRGEWATGKAKAGWDFYALKGVVEAVIAGCGRRVASFCAGEHPCFPPGRCARVLIGDREIGWLGEVKAEIRSAYDLPDPVYLAELDLDAVRELAGPQPQYQPTSRFPAVVRDVAFLAAREVAAARAEEVIRESAGQDLESLELFDAYQGKPLPAGQRNLAFSLTFRRPDRTLTDADVEAAMQRVREALRRELGAQIREQ